MDPTKTPKPEQKLEKPFGWKCTADGKHWKVFKTKKCRYCLPVNNKHEFALLQSKV